MTEINRKAALTLRLRRQNLHRPDRTPYDEMFRLMSPVPTTYWVEPGTPPSIEQRFTIDDKELNQMRREERTIIKGRFRGGNVGYIFRDDLPLMRAAYQKELTSFNETDELILETIRQEGGMSPSLIKELTGLLSKQIGPSLQKLQKAFILFEDQIDGEKDRAFYLLEDEFFDTDFSLISHGEAIEELIRRFCHLNVFISEGMVKSFTRLSNRDIREAMDSLENNGTLLPVLLSDKKEQHYILASEKEEIGAASEDLEEKIHIFDLNDFYVTSQEHLIKDRYARKPCKTLKYIMYRGEFIGALLGHFRFGPDDLEDVVLDIPESEKARLGPDIIGAVYSVYPPENHILKRFEGELL